ncbi:MAG: IclR family transcriptional regulator [Burkholderiales bacterium]|nr:IclR family transcriptional regulator [Burkholderiales bacterium]
MTSLARMLAILDLFDEGASVWTAEAIAGRLGYSLPTGYRYVRELSEAGLLRRDAGGTYVLGPRVIELDYRIRVGDPMIMAGQRVMRALADDTGCDVVLGTIYGERIVTIHQEHGGEGIAATYGRGRRMPLFRGMMSKVILAELPRPRLRRLHEHHREEAQGGTLPPDWEGLVLALKAVRKAGYSISQGELDPGLVGIAVPLVDKAHRLIAALGFAITGRRFATSDNARLVALLREAADRIARSLPATIAEQRPASRPRVRRAAHA